MKLLVNTPSGTQEIITVGEGGGYFDATRVIWDERTDGALPAITLGGMVRDGDNLVLDPALLAQTQGDALHTARAALIKQIDADTDAIYGTVQGNRGPEYVLAESEAASFKAAGYTGTVPPSVASWASAKGWTATQSANDILATAAAWRGAQSAIRATRLSCKEIARTAGDLSAVSAQWSAFLVTIKAALGVA